MLLGKKGVLTELRSIIIILAGFVVISTFLFVFLLPQISAKAPENICHASVLSRVSTSITVADADLYYAPLLCETIEEEVGGNREEIKAQFAEAAATCWWMFNEGRQDDLFSTAEIKNVFGWDSNENQCFLCYTLLVDEQEIRGGTIDQEELFTYFEDTNYPEIQGRTYLDYIQFHGGPGALGVISPIEGQHAYGVAYLSKSAESSGWTWADTTAVLAVGGTALACFTGVGCAVALGVGVSAVTYEVAHTANIIESVYSNEERAVSTVVIDQLGTIQASGCEIIDGS